MASTRYVAEVTGEFGIDPLPRAVKITRGQEVKGVPQNVLDVLLANDQIREANENDFVVKAHGSTTYKDVAALIPPTSLEQPHAGAEIVTPPELETVIPAKTGEKTEAGDTVTVTPGEDVVDVNVTRERKKTPATGS